MSSNTNPTKIGGELGCSESVSNSCPTSGTRRVTLVTNPCHDLMKEQVEHISGHL
jgi:hypothetical protein